MKKTSFFVASVVFTLLGGLSPAQQRVDYKIVVHSSNPISSMPKEQVSKLFLKKVSKWRGGEKVLPVDLVETSQVRASFSLDINGRTVAAVKAYWRQKIFSGRGVPPPEEPSDGEVVAYVRANPGAIGYVSATAAVGDCKILKITER